MLTPEAAGIAADRLNRLIHAWLDPVIPVLRATVREASDVLEMTAEDVARHSEVDRLLTDDAASIERAMGAFREVVTGRSARLLAEALERFPLARLFAADSAEDGGGDPTSEHSFHEDLGITGPIVATVAKSRLVPAVGGDLDLGDEWIGRQDGLREVVREAAKQLQIDPTAHALPMGARSGFDYARWIYLGSPDRDTYFAFGIASRWAIDGALRIGCRSTRAAVAGQPLTCASPRRRWRKRWSARPNFPRGNTRAFGFR